MDIPLRWYKKSALTGNWTALVRAASEAEVREMHEHEQRLFPALAQQYPGSYRVEALPPAFVPPEPLAALERMDFAKVERELGLHPVQEEEAEAAPRERDTLMSPQERAHLPRSQMLEHLIAEHQEAIAQQDPLTITHETIIMALHQVQRGWVYAGQAARILAEIAERVRDEPEKVALYRAAIAELARIAESESDE